MLILLIVFIVGVSYLIWSNAVAESYSTLNLWELNKSKVPQENIISRTDEHFKRFPKLALVILDNNKKPLQILENGNRLYPISLTQEERYSYNGLAEHFLEYQGKYYFYGTISMP